MARAYPGYVYQPFPKMVGDSKSPLGYKIVNSQEELDELNKEEVKEPLPVTKRKSGPKPKIKEE